MEVELSPQDPSSAPVPPAPEASDSEDVAAVSDDEGEVIAGPDAFATSPSERRRMKRSDRPDHLQSMIQLRRASMRYLDVIVGFEDSSVSPDELETRSKIEIQLNSAQKQDLQEESAFIKRMLKGIQERDEIFGGQVLERVEVRMIDFSYRVPVIKSDDGVQTVMNQSLPYIIYRFLVDFATARRAHKAKEFLRNKFSVRYKDFPSSKLVLNHIDLVLKPGKMYLVLGPPASGKTTLLRAIAGLLKEMKHGLPASEGRIEYNGLSLQNSDIYISNVASFTDQIDRHQPRLTVKETFDFAFQCKSGGTHVPPGLPQSERLRQWKEKMDAEKAQVKLVLDGLGLSHVADTFVGDSDVRGVSGGQRRRVTVGEMMQKSLPVGCADEISTGLDAASTYDICHILMRLTSYNHMTKIISLLQPSPETYSLFDEVILLAEGCVIYAGPVNEAKGHFTSLGYKCPVHMDVADFLGMVATPDGAQLIESDKEGVRHYTPGELAESFRASPHGKRMKAEISMPYRYKWDLDKRRGASRQDIEEPDVKYLNLLENLKIKYANSFARSMWLNLKRNLTTWSRDKRFLIANIVKNVIMGVSVGGVFWNTDSVVSIFGVLFQGMLFIMLGAMTSAPSQMADRIIYYKHADANFFPTFSYVIGRSIALIPQATMDCVIFGSILYWMVRLEESAKNFFIFLAILIVFNIVMNQMLSVFAAISPTKGVLQGCSAFILLLLILFCGFIVNPDVIPNYYLWLYWWNPLAWAYRSLVVNEFQSPSYDVNITGTDFNEGEQVLFSEGFRHKGEPFGREWIGYGFAYLVPYILVCITLTGLGLKMVRVEGGKPGAEPEKVPLDENKHADGDADSNFDLPFTRVDLSFENICYEVKSSVGNNRLKLLNNINGVFGSGHMCALMGSSGAGKTTLMDVIALRKSSGIISGEVRLNGFLQDAKSFRRCSGYVEQFDVQSPELTVRETILFSARLRLDPSDTAVASDQAKIELVNKIIDILELTPQAHALVGSDEGGGLSFEQKKRLSIAVELAASPSILFLDEPTSGLDSRAAMLVMKSMKKVAMTGRTVCATIHQPSSAVFEMFDDLLLLKKGGEVVFFGELGKHSRKLTDYFEARGAEPIMRGENPATWMLTVITGGKSGQENTDFAKLYRESNEFKDLQSRLVELKAAPDEAKRISYESQYSLPFRKRNHLLNERLVTVYWRSPAYNYGRMFLSVLIGFLVASVFVTNRKPEMYSENEMNSILSTIFISFIIIGVLSITTVLPVMLKIRDVFYRHRAAGMMGHASLALGLGVAEKRFIIISSLLFCVVFYFTMGLANDVRKFIGFWGFFTFNLAIYSYFGQAFMCLVRGMATAQILASVFIGINNFFSGLIVRPQYLTGFFQITYWITPGHYVFEGMVTTQFYENETPVQANRGSDFYNDLVDEGVCDEGTDNCVGTVTQFIETYFGGRFNIDHMWYDALVLGMFLIIARVLTYFALKHCNYTAS